MRGPRQLPYERIIVPVFEAEESTMPGHELSPRFVVLKIYDLEHMKQRLHNKPRITNWHRLRRIRSKPRGRTSGDLSSDFFSSHQGHETAFVKCGLKLGRFEGCSSLPSDSDDELATRAKARVKYDVHDQRNSRSVFGLASFSSFFSLLFLVHISEFNSNFLKPPKKWTLDYSLPIFRPHQLP